MNDHKKPFQVAFVVKQKNGALYKAIKEKGWTVRYAARFLGINVTSLYNLINMRERPPRYKCQRDGAARFKGFQEKLMELTGKSFEDLFPDEIYANDEVMKNVKSVDFFIERDLATLKLEPGFESNLLTLPEISQDVSHVEEMIAMIKRLLTDRQWRVFERIYLKGMTQVEVAKEDRVSHACVQQTEQRALRKLRKHKHILAVLKGDEDTELNRSLGKSGFDSLTERVIA